MIFSVEYNEDLNFTIDMDSAYYSCSMMLNGEFLILRLNQVMGEAHTLEWFTRPVIKWI